jgi:hypothetical protein
MHDVSVPTQAFLGESERPILSKSHLSHSALTKFSKSRIPRLLYSLGKQLFVHFILHFPLLLLVGCLLYPQEALPHIIKFPE